MEPAALSTGKDSQRVCHLYWDKGEQPAAVIALCHCSKVENEVVAE